MTDEQLSRAASQQALDIAPVRLRIVLEVVHLRPMRPKGAIHASAQDDVPASERLVAAGSAYVHFAASSPGLFRVMFHPSLKPLAQHPGLLQAAGAALAVLKKLVGEVSAAPRKAHVIAAWATIHGQAVLQLDQHLVATFGVEDSQADTTARAVMHILVDGLSREK